MDEIHPAETCHIRKRGKESSSTSNRTKSHIIKDSYICSFDPTLLWLGDLLADFADEAEGGRHAGHEGALGRPARLTCGGDVIRV